MEARGHVTECDLLYLVGTWSLARGRHQPETLRHGSSLDVHFYSSKAIFLTTHFPY